MVPTKITCLIQLGVTTNKHPPNAGTIFTGTSRKPLTNTCKIGHPNFRKYQTARVLLTNWTFTSGFLRTGTESGSQWDCRPSLPGVLWYRWKSGTVVSYQSTGVPQLCDLPGETEKEPALAGSQVIYRSKNPHYRVEKRFVFAPITPMECSVLGVLKKCLRENIVICRQRQIPIKKNTTQLVRWEGKSPLEFHVDIPARGTWHTLYMSAANFPKPQIVLRLTINFSSSSGTAPRNSLSLRPSGPLWTYYLDCPTVWDFLMDLFRRFAFFDQPVWPATGGWNQTKNPRL